MGFIALCTKQTFIHQIPNRGWADHSENFFLHNDDDDDDFVMSILIYCSPVHAHLEINPLIV